MHLSAAPPPEIFIADSHKCRRAIKLQWNPPLLLESKISGYQVTFRSVHGESKRVFNLSGEVRSLEFDGLEMNTVYELNVRVRDLNGFGLWAKEQLTTTAGEKIKPLKISLPRHIYLLKAKVCNRHWDQM